jgi:hypothetical protein
MKAQEMIEFDNERGGYEGLRRTRGRDKNCDLLVLIRLYICDMAPL